MLLMVNGCLLLLNTLKYCVVEPRVVKTVSNVRVSVLNERLFTEAASFLQLLKNSNTNAAHATKINLKTFATD